MTTCEELVRDPRLAGSVDRSRYWALHPEGRRLVSGWFERAWEARDCEPEDSFEPYVFAFVAFNAWASCVTALDKDREWMDALLLDQALAEDFSMMKANPTAPLGHFAHELRQLWPIFEVQSLRRLGIDTYARGEDRREIVNGYLQSLKVERLRYAPFEPRCWKRHRDEGEEVPLDWPHTLTVLYRVRCNLFHGEKARHSEMDQRVVYLAFRVLVGFFGGTIYKPSGFRDCLG